MNEQLGLLISIQKIDSEILSVAEEIEALPDKLGEARAGMKEISASFERVREDFQKSEKKKKQKEDELEDTQDKLDKLKAKSMEIKTNKEYEAHLKEIKAFEGSKYQIEEEILSVMEVLDGLTKDLKKEETKLKKSEEDFRQEEKALAEEKNRLYSRMDVYKEKRKALADRIDEELYERYMDIIKTAGGIAVVQTKNEVCLGCHTNIPPQLYNDIKTSQGIYTCYNCNRFLFYSVPVNDPQS